MITEAHRAKLRANIAKARAVRFAKKHHKDFEEAVESVCVEPKFMQVHQIPINNRVVLAKDSDNLIRTVYVGENENFVYGDKIQAKPHPTDLNVWMLTSQMPLDRRRF